MEALIVVGEIGKFGASELKIQHAHRCLLKEVTRTVHLQVEAQLFGSYIFPAPCMSPTLYLIYALSLK